jgi:hypothetical protein
MLANPQLVSGLFTLQSRCYLLRLLYLTVAWRYYHPLIFFIYLFFFS